MRTVPDHNVPDPSILDLLSPYAWKLIERCDMHVREGYWLDVPDMEEYIRERYDFTLRVLCDIASLPTTREGAMT